jgi:hypothetical protein
MPDFPVGESQTEWLGLDTKPKKKKSKISGKKTIRGQICCHHCWREGDQIFLDISIKKWDKKKDKCINHRVVAECGVNGFFYFLEGMNDCMADVVERIKASSGDEAQDQ